MNDPFIPGSRVRITIFYRGNGSPYATILRSEIDHTNGRPYSVVAFDNDELMECTVGYYNDMLAFVCVLTKEELLTHHHTDVRILAQGLP